MKVPSSPSKKVLISAQQSVELKCGQLSSPVGKCGESVMRQAIEEMVVLVDGGSKCVLLLRRPSLCGMSWFSYNLFWLDLHFIREKSESMAQLEHSLQTVFTTM